MTTKEIVRNRADRQSFVNRLIDKLRGDQTDRSDGETRISSISDPVVDSEPAVPTVPRPRALRSSTNPFPASVWTEPSEFDLPSPRAHSSRVPHNSARAGRYFATDGADEIVDLDDRFREEDHYTNHSGDQRIGTHGR